MKYILILSFVLAGLSLSACGNTFYGVGKDVERAGATIRETFE